MIKIGRRTQHFSRRRREYPEPGGVIDDTQRAHVQDIGLRCGVDELQVLRDEINVDEAASNIFQIPDIILALLERDRTAHVRHVHRDRRRITRARQDVADDFFYSGAKAGRR